MTAPGSGDQIGRFLTVADAAEILAVEVAVVDDLIRSGELPAIRVGASGPWRIERTQLANGQRIRMGNTEMVYHEKR